MKAILEAVNSTGTVFVDFAWPMLVQSSVLIAVLLGLDAILRKRARAVLRYWIWMIVLVKLMLPTTLAAPTSPAYWLSDALRSFVTGLYSPAETSATRSVATSVPPASPAGSSRTKAAPPGENADSQPGFSASVRADGAIAPTRAIAPVAWQGCVFLAWLAAIVVMTALLIQRTSFVRSLVAQSETASDALAGILQLACQQMHVSTRVVLRLSPVITSPCVCGLIRPTILMPQSLFDRVSEPRFKAILLHELAHIKRGDLWVSCFQTIVQIAYIYNPLLWVANATIRKVREQAADETVLVALGEEADDYPKTLLDVSALAFGSPALSLRFLGVAESKKALHRRIQHMLTRPVPQSANIGTVGIIAILVVAAILLPMARAEKSNKDVPVAASPTSVQAPQKAPVAEEGNVFVDPNTGITFRKAGIVSGPSDVIESTTGLRISPNGKFLLSRVTVVPLDGSQPFTLADFPRGVFEGAWSPNGKKVAVEGGGTWVIPVNSETGRPTGPAEKVHESGFGLAVWSPDSEGLRFLPAPGAVPGFGHASLRHSRLTEVADGSKPAKRSPDGKQVAFVEFGGADTVLSVKPVAGGPARNVANGGTPILWSADSAWLIYSYCLNRCSSAPVWETGSDPKSAGLNPSGFPSSRPATASCANPQLPSGPRVSSTVTPFALKGIGHLTDSPHRHAGRSQARLDPSQQPRPQ